MSEKLTPQQRANLFAMSTRQNLQMMAKQSTSTGSTTLQFTLPKARLLSNIFIRVKATVNVKHASKTSLENNYLTPYRILRRLSLDLNNGFAPYTISGEALLLLNMITPTAKMCLMESDYFKCPKTFTASAEGTDNEFYFTLQMPVTLNQRDPVGLILLQSEQTTTDLRLDIGNPVEMYPDSDISGYTIELKSLEAQPMLETFSIPANNSAYPDLSVLKLCQDRTDTITAAGQQIVKLSTGTIYRKLLLYIADDSGNPADEDFITSNIDLVFNQADTNYSVNPAMLRAKNCYDLGSDLPKGVYIFDFSNQGFPSYGGTRDYIDTERLTEFWIRFNTSGKGSIKIISECLARLV